MRARERPMSDPLIIAGREFSSRLLLGTGKFPSNASLAAAIAASGTEIVTVALRRVDPTASEDILDAIDPDGVLLLTNTSGAIDADEAVRLARLAGSAFRLAVEAGRRGYLAGLPSARSGAEASSPLTGFLAAPS